MSSTTEQPDVLPDRSGMSNGRGSADSVATALDGLPIESFTDIAARVDTFGDPGWLARPVWPADAYGVIGAEDKLGKTWAILDLAVAKAVGGLWLGLWPVDEPGRVLAFLGEGGERKMTRRLRAVARWYGKGDQDLEQIRVCLRVPHLTNELHLALLNDELWTHRPSLVIVDPLYLAARGANGASLYEMGATLERVQALVQQHGAALVVVTHWNQTGTGSGRARFTGAGPAEWGRVTISLSAEGNKRRQGDKSIVKIKAQVVGDEIADTEATFTRTVWADDPDDLTSPMHYELEVHDEDRVTPAEWNGPTECMAQLAAFFADRPGIELSTNQVTTQARAAGITYRNQVIAEALERLAIDGRLTVRTGARNARIFATPTENQ